MSTRMNQDMTQKLSFAVVLFLLLLTIASIQAVDDSQAKSPVQEKQGPCQETRAATGYSSIAQFEGQWYRRYRSRIRLNEPTLQCASNRYRYLGKRRIVDTVIKQFSDTKDWLVQNETGLIDANDQSTWVNDDSKWRKRIIFFDEPQGVALVYSCFTTANQTHLNVGSLLTRSPATLLAPTYLNSVLQVFAENGIYDVLPLLLVDHRNCSGPNYPLPTHSTVHKKQ